MALGLFGANWHLDRVYGSGTPASFYVAVMTEPAFYIAVGSDLIEPVGMNYSRVEVPNDDEWWPPAADGFKANGLDIVFPTASGTWGNMRFWALLNASTAGDIITWGGMTSRLVVQGSTLQLRRDQLSITAR